MPTPIPIVIDTDAGADPDDAFALALALASPEVEVLGVTVVSGDVERRARIVARLLGLAGRADVPVFKGEGRALDPRDGAAMLGTEGEGLLDGPAAGPEATIAPGPAVDWLVATARRRPFHVVAIGPLTNVAHALRRDPGFAGRLRGLTIMGGVWDEAALPAAWRRAVAERGSLAAWPDYNTMADATAAAVVAAAAATAPTTWVPLEVTVRAPLRREALDRLPAAPLTAALREMVAAWQPWFGPSLPEPDPGWSVPADAIGFLHDPLAVAALVGGDWLRLAPVRCRGEVVGGVFRLRAGAGAAGAVATVATDVDGERFAAFCLDRIAALAARRLRDPGRRPS